MRRPSGIGIDNPDVIDRRGEVVPPDPAPYRDGSWDGVSPLVLKSEAQKTALQVGALAALGAFLLGRATVLARREPRIPAIRRSRSRTGR